MFGELLVVNDILVFFLLFLFVFMHFVEDETLNDFIALRSMTVKTDLNDLRDGTHNNHYENYQYKKIKYI